MILKAETRKTATVDMSRDLSLIISEFSSTIAKYECEAVIPISMWVEIESGKNELIRVINIINDEGVDLAMYDKNNDIHTSIAINNDSSPYNTTTADSSYSPSSQSKRSGNCNICNPIKINFSSKISKPEIKANLSMAIDMGNMMFSSSAPLVCSTSIVLSQGCIPDLVKILGTFLMALNTIISSVNLESLSLNSFISGTIGAVLDISIKKAMIVLNISVTKSDCLSKMIKEIMSYLPTSQSINNRLDPELLKKFNLYNKNPTDLNALYDSIDRTLTNKGKAGVDNIFNSMNMMSGVVDNAIQRVNGWLDGLFNLSNYLPCEKERSSVKPSELIEEISNILTIINTIRALIDKKYKKKACGETDPNKDTSIDTPLTPDEIAEVINNIINIDAIVTNNDGNTIGIILPSVELKTIYLDTFGCNLPTFMDFLNNQNSDGTISTLTNPIQNSNTTAGENEINENSLSDSIFSTTKPLGINASSSFGYGALKPVAINISSIPDEAVLSGDFVNISDSLKIVSTLMTGIIDAQKESQNLIREDIQTLSNSQQSIYSNEIVSPDNINSNDTNDIAGIIKDLEQMSLSIVAPVKREGCE